MIGVVNCNLSDVEVGAYLDINDGEYTGVVRQIIEVTEDTLVIELAKVNAFTNVTLVQTLVLKSNEQTRVTVEG